MKTSLLFVAAGVLVARTAAADTTAQSVPFSQDWSNAALITTDNDWSGVPGVIGYNGQSLTSGTGTDPQTLTADGSGTTVQVLANQSSGNIATGGVAEFDGLTDHAVALKGSSTRRAPHLVVRVNTTGFANVRVQYDLRDLDSTSNDVTSAVALQYRVGTSGAYTNIAAGFVSDASTGGTATKVTHVNAVLPADAGNVASVDIRIITADAVGSDEYIGVDNITVGDAATPPSAVGASTPDHAPDGGTVLLTATTTPGQFPTSTGVSVLCTLTPIGGGATQALFDDGSNGDVTAGDGIFSLSTTIGAAVTAGAKTLNCVVNDAQARHGNFTIGLSVDAVCGDGRVEGTEVCDDSGTTAGDGCSATCTVESGYSCAGSPSVCTDNDECALNTDNCDANAACANLPGGFACTCNSGYSGDGVTCTDVDECTNNLDDCDVNAACANTTGSFTCTCNTGYGGDGHTGGTGCSDVDECTLQTDTCDVNATCGNTVGGFTCTCISGYSGDGFTCADVNECLGNPCDTNATCTNSPGTFSCACDTGYSGDGFSCADVDECQLGTDNCSTFATCANTTGSFTCTCDTGYSGNGVNCAPVCGDAVVVTGEACDDGGTEAADGCDALCAVEDGWECSGSPSTCVTTCGDGIVVGAEGCDDAGTDAGDGCDAACQIEDGWNCTGMPSTCSPAALCGDGTVDAGEQCDDNNTDAGDGCDPTCTTESGFICDGASPTVCVADSDDDGVADTDDNCPDQANANQADADGDGIGDACDTPDANTGCCSTGGEPTGGVVLLGFVVAGAIARRRRR